MVLDTEPLDFCFDKSRLLVDLSGIEALSCHHLRIKILDKLREVGGFRKQAACSHLTEAVQVLQKGVKTVPSDTLELFEIGEPIQKVPFASQKTINVVENQFWYCVAAFKVGNQRQVGEVTNGESLHFC